MGFMDWESSLTVEIFKLEHSETSGSTSVCGVGCHNKTGKWSFVNKINDIQAGILNFWVLEVTKILLWMKIS